MPSEYRDAIGIYTSPCVHATLLFLYAFDPKFNFSFLFGILLLVIEGKGSMK